MAALGGAMREHAIVARRRLQPRPRPARRAGDEAVDHHRAAARRRAEHRAGHHREFVAAEFGQHIERRGGIAARRGALRHRELAGDPGGIETGAGADAIDQRQPGARRCISNAAEVVLPIPISPIATMSVPASIEAATIEAPRAMASSASRSVIAGSRMALRLPRRIFAAIKSGMRRKIGIDPGIDHPDRNARRPRQHD